MNDALIAAGPTNEAAPPVPAGAADAGTTMLLPGLELPSGAATIVSWAILVLALLGLFMLVISPFILIGIKGALRHQKETLGKMAKTAEKLAEWDEYNSAQLEEMAKQQKKSAQLLDDHAAAGRKRTQAQAAQAVQLGKLLQQQIDAISRLRKG